MLPHWTFEDEKEENVKRKHSLFQIYSFTYQVQILDLLTLNVSTLSLFIGLKRIKRDWSEYTLSVLNSKVGNQWV